MMQIFQHHTARVPQRYSRCCIGDHTHIPNQGICVSFQRATVSCQQDGCFLVETKPAGHTMRRHSSCQQDGLPRLRLHPVDRMTVAGSDSILSTGWMVPSGVHASWEMHQGVTSVLSTGWSRSNPAPSCQQDGIEARNYPVDRTYRESISLLIIPGIRPTKGSSCQQDDSRNTAGSDITEFLSHSDAVILSTGRSVPVSPPSWQQDDFIQRRHPVNRMNLLCPSLILTTGWTCNRPYVHYGWKPHSGDGPPPPRSRLREHPQTPPRAGFGVSGTSDFEDLP